MNYWPKRAQMAPVSTPRDARQHKSLPPAAQKAKKDGTDIHGVLSSIKRSASQTMFQERKAPLTEEHLEEMSLKLDDILAKLTK